ncbi:MAG: SRPBCC domain-containing protein [Spirochaetia bacterium]|nr:SRPBCC domain-containing protein [Spirochaetia bacterium]
MSTAPSNEFVITRTFNAPRDKVFKAWTDPAELKKWFAPEGSDLSEYKMDFKPGGMFHYCQKGRDGSEVWGKWVFVEIVKPEKLVLIQSFSDRSGASTRHPMAPVWPLETHSITTFVEKNGKTEMTLRWTPYKSSEEEVKMFLGAFSNMNQGWAGTFAKLDDYFAKN